jgi:hypothetical protein
LGDVKVPKDILWRGALILVGIVVVVTGIRVMFGGMVMKAAMLAAAPEAAPLMMAAGSGGGGKSKGISEGRDTALAAFAG